MVRSGNILLSGFILPVIREIFKTAMENKKEQKIISKTALSVTVIFAIVSIWNVSLYGFTEKINRWAIKT